MVEEPAATPQPVCGTPRALLFHAKSAFPPASWPRWRRLPQVEVEGLGRGGEGSWGPLIGNAGEKLALLPRGAPHRYGWGRFRLSGGWVWLALSLGCVVADAGGAASASKRPCCGTGLVFPRA